MATNEELEIITNQISQVGGFEYGWPYKYNWNIERRNHWLPWYAKLRLKVHCAQLILMDRGVTNGN